MPFEHVVSVLFAAFRANVRQALLVDVHAVVCLTFLLIRVSVAVEGTVGRFSQVQSLVDKQGRPPRSSVDELGKAPH